MRSFNLRFEEFCSIWDQLADYYDNSVIVGVGIKDVVEMAVEMASYAVRVASSATLPHLQCD